MLYRSATLFAVCFVLYRLGNYVHKNFDDDRVRTPLTKFQKAIDDIEDDLNDT